MVDPAIVAMIASVQEFTSGALGTGIAMALLLIGMGFGVVQYSPVPALCGLSSAVWIHWAPALLLSVYGVSSAELDAHLAHAAQATVSEKASAPILVMQNKPAPEQTSAAVVKVDKAALWENQE